MRESRLILIALLSMAFSGCAINNWLFPPAPFSDRAPCVLPPGASKEHIVQHINRNILGTETQSGLKSWKSTSVNINGRGFPVQVPAHIEVEAPHNFRLRVSAPLGGTELVDMGSNAEQFWFWAKDTPNVILASHEDLPMAQQLTKVPFHPDWLMEVMGVIPIDAAGMALSRGKPDSSIVDLVKEIPSPAGGSARKVIRINSCHGIVVEHALYDSRNVLVASARLGNHRIDEATGIVTPRLIRLDFPQMHQQITMAFHDMWINPPSAPPQAWHVPQKDGCPPVELRQLLSQANRNSFDPFGMPPQARRMSPEVNPFAIEQPPVPIDSQPVITPTSASEQPSAYSGATSQSSSAPPRQERGLFGWPWRRRN